MHILWQLQLSNYFANEGEDSKFSLTGDSNWTVFISKAKAMLELDPTIKFDIVMPENWKCHEDYLVLLIEHGIAHAVNVIQLDIMCSALSTRYDFDYVQLESDLAVNAEKYTHVYINDPCLTANYMSVFNSFGLRPKYITQCHFLNTPSNPLVPTDVSYWWRTVEAYFKSDLMIWHSEAQENEFFAALSHCGVLHADITKSFVWKSGHSIAGCNRIICMDNLRFDPDVLENGKPIVWLPNRIGGLGKSFDYTNNGAFMFDTDFADLDFIIVAGNPSQKISNDELAEQEPRYMKLVDGALNLDEYTYLSRRADIVVALYTKDSNGGIAVLEAIHNNVIPMMTNVNEYKKYFDSVNWPFWARVGSGLNNTADVLHELLTNRDVFQHYTDAVKRYVDEHMSLEATTKLFMERLTRL